MAAVAEAELLGGSGRFHSVDGRAEATDLARRVRGPRHRRPGLPLVLGARSRGRSSGASCGPGGGVALVWNLRRLDLHAVPARLRGLPAPMVERLPRGERAATRTRRSLRGLLRRDRAGASTASTARSTSTSTGLRGRLLSSSYTPKAGDPTPRGDARRPARAVRRSRARRARWRSSTTRACSLGRLVLTAPPPILGVSIRWRSLSEQVPPLRAAAGVAGDGRPLVVDTRARGRDDGAPRRDLRDRVAVDRPAGGGGPGHAPGRGCGGGRPRAGAGAGDGRRSRSCARAAGAPGTAALRP